MKNNQQYNKHKKRSHRSHKQSLVGMQLSKTARPESLRFRRFLLRLGRSSGKYLFNP